MRQRVREIERVVVAEWLRRQTRNLLGSSRAGSNPADSDGIMSDIRVEQFLAKI